MPLELAGLQSGFIFEDFFKRFSLRYQILCVDFFYCFLDFGIDICDGWIES
jgi:hypothetical protein